MKIAGHSIWAMFDRYNIAFDTNLETAMQRQSDDVAERGAEPPKIVPLRKKGA